MVILLVIDADGLKLLAQIPDWHIKLPALTVLTPHPGEMSVLTGLSKDDIQNNREFVAEKYAKEWGHIVVLKGAFTVVAAPDGRTAVLPFASAALARERGHCETSLDPHAVSRSPATPAKNGADTDMSKSNVNPNHYKVAGRERQGEGSAE